MVGGKAHGLNRQYQVQCRDLLRHRHADLKPYAGDGVDVPFEVGGTTWSFDVALEGAGGDLIVAECRRRKEAVKQGDVAEFAYKVELLRKHLDRLVAGVFFAKTRLQLGAVKVGDFEGISMAVVGEDAQPPGFAISFHRYDVDRERRCIELAVHIPSGRLGLTELAPTVSIGVKDEGAKRPSHR